MDTTTASQAAPFEQPSIRPDLLEVVHILVLMQGAILVARSIEAVFFLAFAGTAAAISLGLTAIAAVLTLATAAALAGGSRRARRWTLVAESVVIAVATIDLLLALVMTGEPLGPVALLVGLVIPAAIIVLLRRR